MRNQWYKDEDDYERGKKTNYDTLRDATECSIQIAIKCKVLWKDGFKEANGIVAHGTIYLGLGEEYTFITSKFLEPATAAERDSCIDH